MARRIAAIVNPVSGRRDMLPLVRQVARYVRDRGGQMAIHTTRGAGDAAALAGRLTNEADVILAVGGDGTVNEVINGLQGTRTPMVIYPTGTENLLARELNMPRSPRGVAKRLFEGTLVDYDLGVINGRCFHTTSGVGFDAECIRQAERCRTGHITRLSYVRPTWRALRAYDFPAIRVDIDGELAFEGRGFVLIGVNPQYAGGVRILSGARWDDGLLDACIFPCGSRTKLVVHACRVLLGRHVARGGVFCRRARRIQVTSDQPVPIQIDGEDGGSVPAEYAIRAGAACFLLAGDRAAGRPKKTQETS